LLTDPQQRGSSTVEAVFSIIFLVLLVLGAIEVSLALYARNVVMTSAHEGARAAVELGTDPASAATIARSTIMRAAGGLVTDLEVTVLTERSDGFRRVRVAVVGRIPPFGPVPVPIPLSATATAAQAVPVR
jgi:Flp pilus assembly protein TadG